MIIFIQLLLTSLSFATVQVNEFSHLTGNRALVFECESDSEVCSQGCGANSCVFPIASCTDCMSTNNNGLQLFFVSVGSRLATGEEITAAEAVSYLKASGLIAWNARSVYNTSQWKGVFTDQRFQALCSAGELVSAPMIIDSLDNKNRFQYHAPKIVMCNYAESGIHFYKLNSSEN